jgi:proteasome accessory factor A
MARLHVIFFDNTLSQVACLLKVGVMQIMLAMIEAERVNPDLILDDPVETVVSFSHDPTLEARARLVSGREVTAVELQLLFLEEAKRFVADGGCEGIVPRAEEILALWEDTLLKLAAKDFVALAARLDWVLKLSVLQQVIGKAGLSWDAPQVKHLDHMYSSLDAAEGIYWAYERSGIIERAWTRAMLLRSVEPEAVEDVNWDFIRFKLKNESNRSVTRTLDLASPLRFTRAETERILEEAESLGQLLDALGAPPAEKPPGRMQAASAPGNGNSQFWAALFNRQLTAWRDEPSLELDADEELDEQVIAGDEDAGDDELIDDFENES